MIKKLILSTMLLLSICSLTFNNQVVNNYDVDNIIVDKQKVSVRQKNLNYTNTDNQANIETTNVDYDLRYIYGGKENFQKFDIFSLKPQANTDKDLSYKFLCAKPVGRNLYLYLYNVDNNNGKILNAFFNISKSKIQNKETGLFEETYQTYNARFINSYGYKQRFMKFCIKKLKQKSIQWQLKDHISYGGIKK